MQISFQREDLLKPLSFVAGVVERRQTLPILSYVLVRQVRGEVTLTGTDLEIEIVAKAKGSGKEDGELTVPARKLLDICRALPAATMLEIRKDGDKAIVKAGKSRFTLLTLPPSDFPGLEVAEWDTTFQLPQERLKAALMDTQFCMAQQDVRYYLNGLLLETRERGVRLVATDGHRMALTEAEVDRGLDSGKQVIIPRKGVQEIIRLLEDSEDPAEVRISGNHIQAQFDGVVFTSKLIDGRYPDYSKVMPTSQGKFAIVERTSFREALGRAAILSNEKYRGVRFLFSGNALRISAHNPEQEEAQEEIGVEYQGEPLEIGFNVNYLMEAVGALNADQVRIGLHDANSSCLITTPNDMYPQYVIMPMRL